MFFNTNHYIKVFMDTLYKSKKYAGNHAEAAKYYDVRTMDELAKQHVDREGSFLIRVTGEDSYQAARSLKKQGASDVLVLNFANSISQGGGVRIGARAQEEDLCRTSTLYNSLISQEAFPFYDYNRKNDKNESGSDTAIYSPHVFIIKDEKYHDIAPVEVSVVTMAAPINEPGIHAAEILDQRIYKLLCLAESIGHKKLVLGAWGCGAFGNDPQEVAELFRDNLKKFDCFEEVVFAVRMVAGRDERNYQVFQKVLKKL